MAGARLRRGSGGIGIRRLVDALRHHPRPTGELVEFAGHETSAEEHVLLGVQYGDVGGGLGRPVARVAGRGAGDCPGWDPTTREAAQLLGIPAGTVKTRMMRARAQLRERLA